MNPIKKERWFEPRPTRQEQLFQRKQRLARLSGNRWAR